MPQYGRVVVSSNGHWRQYVLVYICPRSSPLTLSSPSPPFPPTPTGIGLCVQNLLLTEGQLLRVRNVSLPKATFLKLRPQVKRVQRVNPRVRPSPAGAFPPLPVVNDATVWISLIRPQPLILSSSHPLCHSPTFKPLNASSHPSPPPDPFRPPSLRHTHTHSHTTQPFPLFPCPTASHPRLHYLSVGYLSRRTFSRSQTTRRC